MSRTAPVLALLLVACGAAPSSPQPGAPAATSVVTKSAASARTGDPALDFLAVIGRFAPESLSDLGLSGHEDDVIDLRPDLDARARAALVEELAHADAALEAATEVARQEDVAIVRRAIAVAIEELDLKARRFLPHEDLGKLVFSGLRAHLRAPGSEAHALERLRRYAGMAPGHDSLTTLAEARTTERLDAPGVIFPTRAELEDELTKLPVYLAELDELLAARALPGHAEPWRKLRADLEAHGRFVTARILPRARTDFRLPLDVYDFELRRTGVDVSRAELAASARSAYRETLEAMHALASSVGAKRGWPAAEVIRRLKEDQRAGDALVELYRQRLVDLETILEREKLVTLPSRPVRFRLSTPGEAAQHPSPTLDVQALFKKDAAIDFILPSGMIARPGEKVEDTAYTDFSFVAVSWTLAAHEARPGHELQFTVMKERGLSLARSLFAFNSVNVEGWGLYAERMVFPFMPEEAQLASLRMRALREARAFLDPGLHEGTVTIDEARRVLRDELSFSEGVIRQELDRYTFQDPTQATSYFYGLRRLLEIREQAEARLGAAFDVAAFHDFVIDQGLLPPDLLERAVATRFAPAR